MDVHKADVIKTIAEYVFWIAIVVTIASCTVMTGCVRELDYGKPDLDNPSAIHSIVDEIKGTIIQKVEGGGKYAVVIQDDVVLNWTTTLILDKQEWDKCEVGRKCEMVNGNLILKKEEKKDE